MTKDPVTPDKPAEPTKKDAIRSIARGRKKVRKGTMTPEALIAEIREACAKHGDLW